MCLQTSDSELIQGFSLAPTNNSLNCKLIQGFSLAPTNNSLSCKLIQGFSLAPINNSLNCKLIQGFSLAPTNNSLNCKLIQGFSLAATNNSLNCKLIQGFSLAASLEVFPVPGEMPSQQVEQAAGITASRGPQRQVVMLLICVNPSHQGHSWRPVATVTASGGS